MEQGFQLAGIAPGFDSLREQETHSYNLKELSSDANASLEFPEDSVQLRAWFPELFILYQKSNLQDNGLMNDGCRLKTA